MSPMPNPDSAAGAGRQKQFFLPLLPKLIFLLLLWAGLANPLWANEAWEVCTGAPTSGSHRFVKELSQLWWIRYPGSAGNFLAKNNGNFSQRKQALGKGFCRWAILPLEMVKPADAKNLDIKLVAVLWKSYLVPLSFAGSSKEVGLKDGRPWMVYQGGGFFNQTALEQLTSQEQLITFLDPAQLEASLPTLGEEVVFLEAFGKISPLLEQLPASARMLSVQPALADQLRAQMPWLSSYSLQLPDKSKRQTLAVQLGLFTKGDEDGERVQSLLHLLVRPPELVFPLSPLMESLSPRSTAQVPADLRHQESKLFPF